jgi:hypothetical protein
MVRIGSSLTGPSCNDLMLQNGTVFPFEFHRDTSEAKEWPGFVQVKILVCKDLLKIPHKKKDLLKNKVSVEIVAFRSIGKGKARFLSPSPQQCHRRVRSRKRCLSWRCGHESNAWRCTFHRTSPLSREGALR